MNVVPRDFLGVEIALEGTLLKLSLRASNGERPAPVLLQDFDSAALAHFERGVRELASRGQRLDATFMAAAQQLRVSMYRALGEPLARLQKGNDGRPALIRFFLHDVALQSAPWEAMAKAGQSTGFWATTGEVLATRGVYSDEPFVQREVRGAVRILVVSPDGDERARRIRAALAASEKRGEVEWLPPLVGAQAGRLKERLREAPLPHVLHFVGHATVRDDGAAIGLFEPNAEERWLSVELLAQEIRNYARNDLRLLVLEACVGAKPGDFASAAEVLTRNGVDAVVAHLWPVDAAVAACCTKNFYATLTGQHERRGDVAFALNDARRQVLDEFNKSAEAFSPVLYLRAASSELFDLRERKLERPSASPPAAVPAAVKEHPALVNLLKNPFTLLLGDFGTEVFEDLRRRLETVLAGERIAIPQNLPLSTLAQRFAFAMGNAALDEEFQAAVGQRDVEAPLVQALAERVGPGVHTTLLRNPLFEFAVGHAHPDRRIYVIQPTTGREPLIYCRHPNEQEWKREYRIPKELQLDRDLVILRLHRGYSAGKLFSKPLLTEDDYLFGFSQWEAAAPEEALYAIRGALKKFPTLTVGVSALLWNHRVLLQKLYQEDLPATGSVALLGPDSCERDVWEKGDWFVAPRRMTAIELSSADLIASLQRIGASR
jgi:hypothetical protein